MELLLLTTSIALAFAQDPCSRGYHNLISEPHRSSQFQPEVTDHLLCDNGLTAGWYVFDNNDEMPTSCVAQYHCGTHFPLWMQGSHPSQADGIVHRKACSNIYGSSSHTCCDFSLDIQVKNCGSFYVYYLQPVPACAMAYCAGNKKVCDVGGLPAAGGSCPDLYPKLTTLPSLQNPEVTPTKEVRFPCRIDYPIGQSDVGFIVTWTVDGKVLVDTNTKLPVKTVLTGDSRIAYLNAMKLQGNLGKELKCNVTSFHPSKGQGIISDSLGSNGYWCGIRMNPDKINVDEGGPEQTVKVESTIPIPCTSLFPDDCKLTVKLKGLRNPADASLSGCHLDLKLDNVTGLYSTFFKVKATRDFIKDHNHVHEVGFQPIYDFTHPMWKNYTATPISIGTADKDHGHCLPWGDPHFTGFDYKRNYNVYGIGDMVLYKSLNQKRPFEVQMRTWPCGSLHPCICAVIAREGNDIVEVDMCEKRAGVIEAPTVSYLSGHPLEGTTVSKDKSGKIFYINFPSGARLEVKTAISPGRRGKEKLPYMNVDIQAPPDDFGGSEGMCGNWNGVVGDDLKGGDGKVYTPNRVADFTKSWTLPTGTSMFHQLPKYEAHLAPKFEYCSCKQNVDCTKVGNGAINPSKDKGSLISGKGTHHRRSVRSYSDHFPDRDLAVDPRMVARRLKRNADATFPTASGITESQANSSCRHTIMTSSLYKQCQHTDILNNIIEGCIEDIKYADSADAFRLAVMNAFDSTCYNELAKDPTNIQYVNGDPVVNPSISGCPNQCSLNGNCVSGTCHCHHGYTSIDCSVKEGVSPQIHRIRGDGLCDIRARPCRQANVIVDNIMDSASLSCRVTPVDLSEGPPVESGPATEYHGEFLSFLEMQCPIPESNVMKGLSAKGFKVSVTSDGQHYSQESLFIVADGYCKKCTATGVCTQNPNSCFIDGVCYRHGDQNDKFQVCDPSVSTTNWTSSKTVQEVDHYTATFSGCRCPYNINVYDCACCQNGGCQCGEIQPNQCTDCNNKALCGTNPGLFPPPA
ncbi:von Willebrand factor D and EGF domain-containing protein-like isoform X1 [Ostrea edulis]|uniref:von Willebrand factor D and EGF domain-containing protein-like isoform X1 n=1 Tax=Ostrea edulis TaxID=37623 RepID=UPI0024AFE285|nr:von Willebrand factor D and EGF domain-containing protein-like isoform X1 [Ostrea edulis]